MSEEPDLGYYRVTRIWYVSAADSADAIHRTRWRSTRARMIAHSVIEVEPIPPEATPTAFVAGLHLEATAGESRTRARIRFMTKRAKDRR